MGMNRVGGKFLLSFCKSGQNKTINLRRFLKIKDGTDSYSHI